MTEPVRIPINKDFEGVTFRPNIANSLSQVYRIPIPETVVGLIGTADVFKFFARDATNAIISRGRVVVNVTGSRERDTTQIYDGSLINFVGNQSNALEQQKFNNEHAVLGGYFITILVNSPTVLNEGHSDFSIEISEVPNVSPEEALDTYPEYVLR